MSARRITVPAGRMMDYVVDAPELYLHKPAHRLGEVVLIRFASRAALETFNKKGPNLAAVVKTPVRKGCALYRHQCEVAA